MPNEDATAGAWKVDERIATNLMAVTLPGLAEELAQTAHQIERMEARDADDPMRNALPVLDTRREMLSQMLTRMEELVAGLAADKVRTVNESGLVKYIAKLVTIENNKSRGENVAYESNIRYAQSILRDMKDEGVIV